VEDRAVPVHYRPDKIKMESVGGQTDRYPQPEPREEKDWQYPSAVSGQKKNHDDNHHREILHKKITIPDYCLNLTDCSLQNAVISST